MSLDRDCRKLHLDWLVEAYNLGLVILVYFDFIMYMIHINIPHLKGRSRGDKARPVMFFNANQ